MKETTAINNGKRTGSIVREIMKARQVAGSVVVSLPKSLRDPLGICDGDRLMISLDKRNRRLIVTKEE